MPNALPEHLPVVAKGASGSCAIDRCAAVAAENSGKLVSICDASKPMLRTSDLRCACPRTPHIRFHRDHAHGSVKIHRWVLARNSRGVLDGYDLVECNSRLDFVSRIWRQEMAGGRLMKCAARGGATLSQDFSQTPKLPRAG